MELIQKVFKANVKTFDDATLTIEHFISTEKKDRVGDIMRVDGLQLDGVPVVLKQHGFDPDTGSEPIAKPVSLKIAEDGEGNRGILVKTQYYDGSHLNPPDNTGRRLYEKAKQEIMPYWSIGFAGEGKALPGGGIEYTKWFLHEYSQVGVPANPTAKIIKAESIEDAEKIVKEQPNEIFKFSIKTEEKEEPSKKTLKISLEENTIESRGCFYNEKDGNYTVIDVNGKKAVCVVQKQEDKPAFIVSSDSMTQDHMDILTEEFGEQPPTKLKAIADRVAEDIPYSAMSSIWWGMIDELYYNDGSEKAARATVKEMAKIIEPFAIAFSKATSEEENVEWVVKCKEEIKKQLSDKKDDTAVPAPVPEVVKSNEPPVVLELEMGSVQKDQEPDDLELPCSVEEFANIVSESVKAENKKIVNEALGIVD